MVPDHTITILLYCVILHPDIYLVIVLFHCYCTGSIIGGAGAVVLYW